MIQPIQSHINSSNKKIQKTTFKGFWDQQVVKGDKEGDVDRMRRNYNKLLMIYGVIILALAGLSLKSSAKFSLKNKFFKTNNFESLKNNSSVPTIDTCKSLNKNLKASLEKQINLSKVGNDIISEEGKKEIKSNRFLLYGPPGTGKSFFAKVFAKSTDAEYMEILFSDWNSRWSGETGEKMEASFKSILKTAKSNPNKKYVVAFNEIDAVVVPPEGLTQSRGSHGSSKLEERSIFLNYIEILKEKAPNVTIIGTTNVSPKNNGLDRAAMSRFQNLIEVPYPDKDCLYEALKTNLEKIKNNDLFIKNNEASLKELAEKMENRKFSYRNLESIIKEAQSTHLNNIVKGNSKEFKIDYLQEAEKALKLADGEMEKVA